MSWDNDTKLSKNFSLREFTKSQTAARHGIDNFVYDEEVFKNLQSLCEEVVQPVRDYYNIPFSPNSGFRSLALNRLLGSKDTSQHVLGQAVDIEVPTINNFELMEFISGNLNFDQVILEFYNEDDPKSGWVHVSYDRDKDNNRYRVLAYDGKKYTVLQE